VTVDQLRVAAHSGHKHRKGWKAQGIIGPNGLSLAQYGPVEGRRHDAAILGASGVLALLPQLTDAAGTIYRLLGDSAYPLLLHLLRPFINPLPGSPQAALNTLLAQVGLDRLFCS
jgi:hypothetical protein